MQFRDRDVINLAIGGFSAAVIAVLAVAVFGLWRHTEGPALPIIGVVAGVLGFICAILAEYIRRWRGLTASVIALGFFIGVLLLWNPSGLNRALVFAAVVVSGLLCVVFSVPQLIVNLMPEAERIRIRLRKSPLVSWWAS